MPETPGPTRTSSNSPVSWRGWRWTRRTTLGRASEIALGDGLTCRLAGRSATLAFEGRRASFTCGMKDADTIALLGDLEAAEGGFRIVRARITQGAQGFTLASSEPILVTAPR